MGKGGTRRVGKAIAVVMLAVDTIRLVKRIVGRM